MNRDSNVYTFLFATIMVLVVASALAFTASALKDLQNANVRKEKMQTSLQQLVLRQIETKQKHSTKSTSPQNCH